MTTRPIRNPHHTSSMTSIVGGGSYPKPGEISLAHTGILFLDEIAEFSSKTLEVLRQPMEDHEIMISRAKEVVNFPADFILIATMNPCPCGFLTDQTHECTCTPYAIERYRKKLSGPLLDRIDIQLEVPKLKYDDISKKTSKISEKEYKKWINTALTMQKTRYGNTNTFNGTCTHSEIDKFSNLTEKAKLLMQKIVNSLHITGRAYFRLLKVSFVITV